jgi:Uma2 family endonuclease
MATATLVPVEEYLSASYRPDVDYLEGVILERNVGQYDHSLLQISIGSYFHVRRTLWGIRALTEQRLQVKPHRFRIPDVCVLRGDAPIEQIITRPPILCIEILSPEDRMSEMQERVADYLAFGVPYVWVIDPRRRRATAYEASGVIREYSESDILRTAHPDMEMPLAEVLEPAA